MKIGFDAAASAFVAACILLAASPGFAAGGTGGGGGAAGGGGGGGGGGVAAQGPAHMGNMQTGYQGIQVRDFWLSGETQIEIPDSLTGIRMPADTVITLNGTPLRRLGAGPGAFGIDPPNPPQLGPDNILHLVATSVSVNGLLTMDVPCGQPVPVSTDPPVGSSLRNVATLNASWAPLPQNTLPNDLLQPPFISLYGYDTLNGATFNSPSQSLSETATGTSVTVPPMTTPGYMLELSYPGVFVLANGEGSHGVCVRKVRVFYTNN